VCRHRQQVGVQLGEIHRVVTEGLHRVGMEPAARSVRNFGNVGHRLDGADLVVHQHHAGQADQAGRVAGQQPDRVIDDHVATLVQPGLLHPRPQQGLGRLDGRMLEPADHDSGSISRPAGRRPPYRCCVRFAAAGGEDHLVGPCAQ